MENSTSTPRELPKEVIVMIMNLAKKGFSHQAISEVAEVKLTDVTRAIEGGLNVNERLWPAEVSNDNGTMAPPEPPDFTLALSLISDGLSPIEISQLACISIEQVQSLLDDYELRLALDQSPNPLSSHLDKHATFLKDLSQDTGDELASILSSLATCQISDSSVTSSVSFEQKCQIISLLMEGIQMHEVASIMGLDIEVIKMVHFQSYELEDFSEIEEEPFDESCLNNVEVTSASGDHYVGQCLNSGVKHGRGTLQMSNGRNYEGDFRKGFFHGQGTLTCKEYTYTGSFKKNYRWGQGTMTFPGVVLEGAWKRDQLHGKGSRREDNGTNYEGEYFNGKYHGFGTLIKPNGVRYDGQFIGGNEHGEGVQVEDGKTYKGSWFDGFRHGKFSVVSSEGKAVEAIFELGALIRLNF